MADLSDIRRARGAGIAPQLDLLARQPTPAQRAAALLADCQRQAGQPTRGPNEVERAALAQIAHGLARTATAAEQWRALPDKERRLLAAYSGLREANPGEPLSSIAARDWSEFTASERTSIAQGTRALLRRLSTLDGLMRRWWVKE